MFCLCLHGFSPTSSHSPHTQTDGCLLPCNKLLTCQGCHGSAKTLSQPLVQQKWMDFIPLDLPCVYVAPICIFFQSTWQHVCCISTYECIFNILYLDVYQLGAVLCLLPHGEMKCLRSLSTSRKKIKKQPLRFLNTTDKPWQQYANEMSSCVAFNQLSYHSLPG